ncbi:MAG: Cytochrome c heme lyase subunit CcmL [Fluviibacter phosphoraccumulans EoVTN8]
MKGFLKLFVAMWLAIAGAAYAAEAQPLAQNPVVEKRLNAISENLRCLVCQNESLAGSRAELAEDLRREVRHLIEAGKSDKEIIDFLVSRYGDYVLYDPPFKSTTLFLWVGPFVLLAGGLIGPVVFLRRRSRRGLIDEPDYTPATAPEKIVAPVQKHVTGRWLLWLLMALIPIGSILVYLKVGNLAALNPANVKPAPDPNVMVARLQAKMDANPDDPAGWQLLARAYMVMNRPDDAVKAFGHILPLIKQEPQLMADYAEALAATGDLKGARTWINNALQKGSQDPKVLFLAGGLAFDEGNYKQAISYWERILKLVTSDSPEAKFVQENISEARVRMK